MTPGVYYDGRSTRSQPVELQVENGFLHLIASDLRRIELLRGLRFTAAYAHAPSRVELPGGGSVEIADVDAFLELRKLAGQGRSGVERLEASLRYALLSVLVILGAGAVGYLWGIPLAADLIVEHAPKSVDNALAKGSLDQLVAFNIIGPDLPPTQHEKVLSQRFATLAQSTGVPYHLTFRTFKGGPNAFALPDGTILVSTNIEGLAKDDDAMMFVMAHELGHLHYRHSIKALARTTMTSIIMSWYVGDVSSALALATAGVANLRFSRQAESQADAFASKLLHANGLSTKPAAELFRALEDWTPPADKASTAGSKAAPAKRDSRFRPPTYLSTHPATEDRIRMLEQDKD